MLVLPLQIGRQRNLLAKQLCCLALDCRGAKKKQPSLIVLSTPAADAMKRFMLVLISLEIRL